MVTPEQRKKVESYRWLVWGILALMYTFVAFHRMATGVVRPAIESDFGIGASEFAMIGSMYFYAYFLMQIPSGVLADSLGPKKTVTYFSVLAAVGSILFGFAPNLYIAYIGRFMVGIGVSVVFVCIINIQSRWFYAKQLAFMMGMIGLTANLGVLLAQTPLLIVSNIIGWRSTFIGLGIIMFIFAVLTWIIVKNDPSEIGLPSMEELEGRPAPDPTAEKLTIRESLKSVLSNPKTWILSIAFLGMYTGYIILLGTYGGSFLSVKYGYSPETAANLLIVAVIGAAVGGLFIGSISDKLKKRKSVLVFAEIATLIGWLIFLYVSIPSVVLMGIFLFIFGFIMTAFTLTWTMANESNDRRLPGIATGAVNCVGFAGTAVIPVLMGNRLDAMGDSLDAYLSAFFIFLVVMVISVIASFLSTETNAACIYKGQTNECIDAGPKTD